MIKNTFVLFVLGIILYGCTTLRTNSTLKYKTENRIMLGVIGSNQNTFLNNRFNESLILGNVEPIKLKWSTEAFNKNSFNAFLNAGQAQHIELNLTYIDTTDIKPEYLNISIFDKYQLIKNINNQIDSEDFNTIIEDRDSRIVSSITIALNSNMLNQIINAEEVFLENSGLKNFVITLYNNGKSVGQIPFNEGVVLGYNTSAFCWKQNENYQLEIVDLVEGSESCPRKSYKSANRADKKINYYKF